MLGPGVPVRNDERCEWLECGYFLVQTYEAVFGDDPPQKGINYWFYDSEARKFRIVFFSNNGNFTEDGIATGERSPTESPLLAAANGHHGW